MSSTHINSFVGEPVPIEKKPAERSPDFLQSGRTPRIGVLINPRSGGNRNGLGTVRKTIATYPVVSGRDVRTPEDILAAMIEFARKKVDLVVVNGGDGTVQAVLTALFAQRPFETSPLLAVLQSGTTSMIARDTGFLGSPAKALRKLFDWARRRQSDPVILQRPVLRVQAPGHQIRYGMFFGAAGIYQGIQYCLSKVHRIGLRGEIGPGLTLIRFLLAVAHNSSDVLPVVPMTVALDQHPPQHHDCVMILISTLERLFLGLHPHWGSETGPLHYTAVCARPRHFLRALPSIIRGRKGRYGTPQNGYFSHNVHEIRLNFDSGFTLDGQLYTPETRQAPVVIQYGGTAPFLRL